MSDRCIQCGWTISERNMEVVLRGDPMDPHCETLLLHKGGCPDRIGHMIEKGEAETE